jgi:hypothetical protein
MGRGIFVLVIKAQVATVNAACVPADVTQVQLIWMSQLVIEQALKRQGKIGLPGESAAAR